MFNCPCSYCGLVNSMKLLGNDCLAVSLCCLCSSHIGLSLCLVFVLGGRILKQTNFILSHSKNFLKLKTERWLVRRFNWNLITAKSSTFLCMRDRTFWLILQWVEQLEWRQYVQYCQDNTCSIVKKCLAVFNRTIALRDPYISTYKLTKELLCLCIFRHAVLFVYKPAHYG